MQVGNDVEEIDLKNMSSYDKTMLSRVLKFKDRLKSIYRINKFNEIFKYYDSTN